MRSLFLMRHKATAVPTVTDTSGCQGGAGTAGPRRSASSDGGAWHCLPAPHCPAVHLLRAEAADSARTETLMRTGRRGRCTARSGLRPPRVSGRGPGRNDG
jgi:hypothetical protein